MDDDFVWLGLSGAEESVPESRFSVPFSTKESSAEPGNCNQCPK